MNILRDVAFAIRQSRRHPGLPAIVVLSLGCAMGISTSLFSVINAIWFRPWSVDGVENIRIVHPEVAWTEWRYWADHSQAFAGLAAQKGDGARINGRAVFVDFVSANYFHVLNVPMLVGNTFDDRENAPAGLGQVAVISHSLWQTRFGGDANAIGRLITLDRMDPREKPLSFTLVGVAPPGFEGPDHLRRQAWLPLSAMRRFRASGPRPLEAISLLVFGRLAPGRSEPQAQAELAGLRRQFHVGETIPPTPISLRPTARYSQADLPLQSRMTINMMVAGMTFITLVACANASNLLLARGQQRRGETAIRLALGATRAQILRQLLIESFLLCLAAGGIGMLVSLWLPGALFQGLVANAPPGLGDLFQLTFPLDRRVFLWALGVSTLACVAFGLGPALRCSQVDMGEVIKESHGASKRGLMPSILSYQAIVSMMALAIAGLMLRSTPVAEGMRIRRAVADLTAVRLKAAQVLEPRQQEQLTIAVAERLGSIAGSGKVAGMAGEMQAGVSQTLRVTPDYFDLLRLPWASGRTFATSDSVAGVMVVNDAFAERFWPDRTAVGQVLNHDAVVWDKSLIGRQVIGVVRDGHQATPTAYLAAEAKDATVLLVRADRHRLLRELPPFAATLPGSVNVEIVSGSEWIAGVVGPSVLAAWVTMAFGAVALGLGTMGFFSLLDYAVQQRTREMGIRQALGAEPRHIVRCLVEPAARPLLRGIVIGAVGTGLVGFAMRRADLPAGVNPLDVGVYASVAAVLIIAGLLASLGPARRVIRIEPCKALRVD